MVTFRGRHGYDGKAPLIDGFEVVLDKQVVGFIWPGGSFSRSCPEGFVEGHKVLMSQENLDAIDAQCAKVRKMPSEYGWIGVGEPAN
jgi:hypothetical protein